MRLSLKSTSAPRPARIDFDDYVPLRVHWVEPGSVSAVYCRLVGELGGDLEVKLEPLTGELIGIVVNEFPPHCEHGILDSDEVAAHAQPRFDLAPWNPTPDAVPTSDVVRVEVAMCMEPYRGDVKLRLRMEPAARWTDVDGIGIGTTAEGELVCLRLPTPRR